MSLGRRDMRIGIVVGLLGALLGHGVLAARGLSVLFDLQRFANQVQQNVAERLRATINVDVKTPPPPPPPPPEAPAADPTAPPPPENTPPPPKDAPAAAPAAAQAGKILTAPPDPDQPLDLTGQGFVTGTGDRYAGGTTASDGTSQTAVRNPYARGNGTPGATGTAPGKAPPPPPAKDLSRPARPNSTNWSCGFPAEADMDQVDYAVVRVVVTVTAEGRARSVSILNDPGHGFGRLARQCAFRQNYTSGRDRYGKPISRTTPPITVRFTR